MKKKALIIGMSIEGSACLASLLLLKNYSVYTALNKKKLSKIVKKNFDEIYFLNGKPNFKKSFDKEFENFENYVQLTKLILEFIKNQKKKKSKFLFSSYIEIIKKKEKINFKKPNNSYELTNLIETEIIKSYRKMFGLPVFSISFLNKKSLFKTNDWSPKYILECMKVMNFKKIDDYIITNE